MTAIAAALGGIGLACMLFRRTFLGVWVGVQLLIYGMALVFAICGFLSGAPVEGHLFGMFITWAGIAQLVAGFALGVRMFYWKKQTAMSELRALKH